MTDLREQLQTTLGSAYTLEQELGGGGMSRVFAAQETRFGRRVVVKVLPPELAAEVSVERFEREISLAARLQHSHIVPVLSAGESAGLPYYTMPLVAGESLRARLAREGELPVATALKVMRDVASALAYAHSEGVVHRDIKPENILLSAHDALVTDFGVAKAIKASTATAGGTNLTSGGVAIGTPAYMSPEQASGDPHVDHRADLYALGCVAYEMLSGAPPFSGRSQGQMLAAQVSESPETLAKRRSNLSPALANLVMRCLEKRPADRPESASEIVQAIDSLGTPTHGSPADVRSPWSRIAGTMRSKTGVGVAIALLIALVIAGVIGLRHRGGPSSAVSGAEPSSLVVLPFENVGGDTSDAYFADGIRDELAAALGRVPGIRVAGRSSAYAFRGHRASAQEIGRQLNVGSVLDGTVRRSGGQVRLTAELVSTSDGLTRWSDSYQRSATDVFKLQEDLTNAITGALQPVLGKRQSASQPSAGLQGTSNVAAYDLYLQGRFFFDKRGEASLRRAIALFDQAIALDSGFARAHVGRALALAALPYHSDVRPDSVRPAVFASARRALALDPSLAEAHSAMATSEQDAWHWSAADEHYRKALAIDSTNALSLSWYAQLLGMTGRYDEGVARAKRALELDPLSTVLAQNYATALTSANRAREGLVVMRRAFGLDSTLTLVMRDLGWQYISAGFPDSAALLAERYRTPTATHAAFAAAAGQRDLAIRLLRDAKAHVAAGRGQAFDVFLAELALGEVDSSLTWLSKSVDAHDPGLTLSFFPCDPFLARLDGNQRYLALLARLDIPQCPEAVRKRTNHSQ